MRTYSTTCARKRLIAYVYDLCARGDFVRTWYVFARKRLNAYVNVLLLRVERLLQQVPTVSFETCRTKLETMTASHVRSVTIRVPALKS